MSIRQDIFSLSKQQSLDSDGMVTCRRGTLACQLRSEPSDIVFNFANNVLFGCRVGRFFRTDLHQANFLGSSVLPANFPSVEPRKRT